MSEKTFNDWLIRVGSGDDDSHFKIKPQKPVKLPDDTASDLKAECLSYPYLLKRMLEQPAANLMNLLTYLIFLVLTVKRFFHLRKKPNSLLILVGVELPLCVVVTLSQNVVLCFLESS